MSGRSPRVSLSSGTLSPRPLIPSLALAERRKAEEKEQLDEFLARQRDRLASPSQGRDGEEEDEDDIDHSFSHLRIGGKGRMAPPPGRAGGKAKVETEEEKEELRRMQDEARRMQAVRGEPLALQSSLCHVPVLRRRTILARSCP